MSNARCKTASSWVWSARINQKRSSALARYAQEPMFDDEIRAEVIKDIRRMYAGCASNWRCMTSPCFTACPRRSLINEAPFIDWRVRAQIAAAVRVAAAGTRLVCW